MIKRKVNKKEAEEIALFKRAIRYIEKGYGRDMTCKGINFDCGHCRGQLLLGLLNNHLDLIEWAAK